MVHQRSRHYQKKYVIPPNWVDFTTTKKRTERKEREQRVLKRAAPVGFKKSALEILLRVFIVFLCPDAFGNNKSIPVILWKFLGRDCKTLRLTMIIANGL